MPNFNLHCDNNTFLHVGEERPSSSEWKAFTLLIRKFKDLPCADDDYFVVSPEFSCNGHKWRLKVYPAVPINQQRAARELEIRYISIFLEKLSDCSTTATFEFKILDSSGDADAEEIVKLEGSFDGRFSSIGKADFMERTEILNDSNTFLDSNGTLAVVVSIKEDRTHFVPDNPCYKMITEKFNDETTSDVSFEVNSFEEMEDGTKRLKQSKTLHAHKSILQICAPMLAALFDSGEAVTTVVISDIQPNYFQYMLWYVYGGSVSEADLKAHAKGIIDAADKYSIVNLKLEAEAAYIDSATITMDTAKDHLLYADAKNLALLKEVVLDFIAENSVEASQKIPFSDIPGHLIRDLLVAFGRSQQRDDTNEEDSDQFSVMRVSDLKRMLDEKGLDVDGSREAMIEALKNSAEEAN